MEGNQEVAKQEEENRVVAEELERFPVGAMVEEEISIPNQVGATSEAGIQARGERVVAKVPSPIQDSIAETEPQS